MRIGQKCFIFKTISIKRKIFSFVTTINIGRSGSKRFHLEQFNELKLTDLIIVIKTNYKLYVFSFLPEFINNNSDINTNDKENNNNYTSSTTKNDRTFSYYNPVLFQFHNQADNLLLKIKYKLSY